MSSLDLSLSHAIEQNNDAVQMMENGDHSSAISVLGVTLQICRRILDDAENHTRDESVNVASSSSSPGNLSLDQCMQHPNRLLGSMTPRNRNYRDCMEGDQYLHKQALRIPYPIASTPQNNIVVGSVVTFNLALALQLFAIENRQVEEGDHGYYTTLRKAARLYRLGFHIQQVEDTGTNILFTMATINNLGLIQLQLNDHPNAQKCFQYVLSTLMYLTDSRSTSIQLELDGFFRNVSTVFSRRTAPAA